MFQLEKDEYINLRSQFASSSLNQHCGARYLSFAFTELGVAMLSSVLKSEKAIEVNIAIMRAFVLMRQFVLNHRELSAELNKLDLKYDKQCDNVFEAINYLVNP